MIKFIGITDSVSTCDCCGRTNLKRTVALVKEDGSEVFYGTTCAAVALRLTEYAVNASAVFAENNRRETVAKYNSALESAQGFTFALITFSSKGQNRVRDFDGFKATAYSGEVIYAADMYDLKFLPRETGEFFAPV